MSTGNTFIESSYAIFGDVKDALQKNLTEIRKTVIEIDGQFGKVASSIGIGRDQALLFKKTLTDNLSEVTRLGGNVDQIVTQQTSLAETFGRTIALNSEYTDDLYATTQVTGKSAKELFEAYANVGKSVYQVSDDMAGIVQNMQMIGVNAKAVTTAVVTNMDALSKFNFQNGVNGLAAMAAQSAKLRVDMKTGLDFAEKLYDPEAAQDFVQNISNLGIQTSSALKDVNQVRYLALNDPMKLQEELAKSLSKMVDETGSINAIGRQYIKQISSFTSMQEKDLQNMAISYNQIEDKQKAINEAGIKFTDPKEMERLENILQKGKSGEMEVKFLSTTGDEITKAVKDLTSREKIDLEVYLKKQTKAIEEQTTDDKTGQVTLKDLAFIQQGIGEQYKNTLESLEHVLPNAIAGSLSGEKIAEGIVDTTKKVSNEALKTLSKNSDKIMEHVNTITKETKVVTDNAIKAISSAMTEMIEVTKQLKSKITETADEQFKNIFDRNTLINSLKTVLGIHDMISLPGGGDRFYLDEDGIKKFNKKDTVMATTLGPKTKEEAMEYISPKTPTINEVQTPQIQKTYITDLASKINEKTSKEETKKIEASFEPLNINLNVNLKLEGAQNIDKSKIEETLNNMLKTKEVTDQIKTSLESIKGFVFK